MDATDPSPVTLVVCDAGPLIHLDELGCLGLLSDFSRILVPELVWSEVAHHRPQALACKVPAFVRTQCPGPTPDDLEALARLLVLHHAERQALQIAREQNADLLLTDDSAARLAAKGLNLAVHGSLGILLRAIRRGQKSREEIKNLLRKIPTQSTLHIRKDLLADIIRQVDELA